MTSKRSFSLKLALLVLLTLLFVFLAPAALAQDEKELPAGHPPLAPPTADVLPDLPPGSGTGDKAITWDAPEAWTSVPPSSSMRRAQYKVSGAGGDAECIVYYFGPGQGGGAKANADRWVAQFIQPDARPSSEVAKLAEFEVGDLKVLTVEVAGTYGGSMTMGGPSGQGPQEGQMLLGAIAEGPDANWFFKLTGPEATVAAQVEAFDAMLHSLRRGE